jgi:hypothetical protein
MHRLLEVCTGVCIRWAFKAFLAHVTHATMRFPCATRLIMAPRGVEPPHADSKLPRASRASSAWLTNRL